MKPKHSFLLSLLLTLILAANIAFFSSPETQRKTVTIQRVIDGDTLETTEGEKMRLVNINTPERSRLGFEEATQFLKQFENQQIEVEIIDIDKYSRTLVRVYTPEYLNLKIIQQGLGKKFLVDESELSKFSEAESQAIQKEKGLWTKSIYFSCLHSEIDPENEFVILTSNCGEIDLANWILTDESRKEYMFSQTIKNKLTLYSLEGQDNEKEVYWNQKQNVWNNDRDTLYLFDSENNIVHHNSYGY